MTIYIKKFFALLFIITFFVGQSATVFAQDVYATRTANGFSSYVPYTGAYGFGTNMGYYGQQFTDQDVAQLSYNAGARTIRLSLPDWLITGYGTNARTPAFQYYKNIGLKDLTAFLGEPNDPTTHAGTGPDDRDMTVFPGADTHAQTFKGLYEPIWLDAAKSKINPNNTFANYVYKTVSTYGDNVKFWEIINEPDFTYGSNGWADKSQSTSWWNVNPTTNELSNMKAPIFYYVRELRVAYDVIKTLHPDEYVATGGIGYASFLDAMMRNTDNPVDGSVTADYPQKGGAYFDVLSYHVYPMYSLRHWSNDIMNFVYTRHSDGGVDVFVQSKTDFENVLNKYGYNGTTYPKKQWISTETDLPQKTVGDTWGSQDSANNYFLKISVLAPANGVGQIYKYGLGENGTTNDSFDTMGVYGNITPSSTTIANAPKTEQFKVIKTLSTLLYGDTYDAAKTAQINTSDKVRGVAYKDSNNIYTYVLWAKTTIDESESASFSYTFPFTFSGTRREWDFSATNQSTTVGQTVTLTGTPSFFTDSAVTNTNTNTNTTTGTTNQNSNVYSSNTLPAQTPPTGYYNQYNYNNNYSTTLPYQVPTQTYQTTSVINTIPVDPNFTTNTDTPILYGKVVTIAKKLNVRATAGGRLVTQVPYGTTGVMFEQTQYRGATWAHIIFTNGLIGWISARYMQAK